MSHSVAQNGRSLSAAGTSADYGTAYKDLIEAIAREELAGLAYVFRARLIAIGILAGWALTLPFERSYLYLLALAAFGLLGAPPYLLARRGIGGLPVIAAFLLLDAGLLSYILSVPTPYAVDGWPPQLSLRLWNFLWLGVFLVGMALTYSPALVIWTGIATATAWSAGYLWVANLPDSLARTSSEVLSRGLGSGRSPETAHRTGCRSARSRAWARR